MRVALFQKSLETPAFTPGFFIVRRVDSIL
ncbi:hypothetical protein HNR29_003171 [Rhizobium leguminosarum]|nr:hypothetical protein [Rhizobium leguminosarum]